jgi:hypothetical protein
MNALTGNPSEPSLKVKTDTGWICFFRSVPFIATRVTGTTCRDVRIFKRYSVICGRSAHVLGIVVSCLGCVVVSCLPCTVVVVLGVFLLVVLCVLW